ncbi:ABC transporter ATP-binding protein [Corynebacterium kalinowskii]|nr:ATP-binding cassette domain-containing protein [Corynebacterium kalinowskii]
MLKVDCTYGHKLPIGHLDMTFVPGGMYGLRGPNGAGKSTLLSTIAGELDPIEGAIDFDGDGVIMRVGDPIFYPDLTVSEHLKLLTDESDELVDTWRLEDLLPHPPMWLSSGQRQRVFLASQLAVPADVVLIDEPERHLDQNWIEFLCTQLQDRAKDDIVIVASHADIVLQACAEIIDLS